MNLRNCAAGWLGAFCWALLAATQSSQATTYHSQTYGFTIQIPDTWMQLSPGVLREFVSNLRVHSKWHPIIYDSAFEPIRNGRAFSLPYLVVQVFPNTDLGWRGQIAADQFAKAFDCVSGSDMNNYVEQTPSPGVPPLSIRGAFGKWTLDTLNHRYRAPATLNVAGEGSVRVFATGYFGHDSVVQLAYCWRTGNGDPYADDAMWVEDSLNFDPDKAYNDVEAAADVSGGPIFGGIDGGTIASVVVGCAVAAIVFGVFMLRRSPVNQ